MAKAVRPTDPALLSDPDRPFVHRDLSWLLFNERVLSEAEAVDNPLLERVKFLAISASNLDEFFMIRFSSAGRNAERHGVKDPHSRDRFLKIEKTLLNAVSSFTERQGLALESLQEKLCGENIRLCSNVSALNSDDPARLLARDLFDAEVLPKLPAPEPFGPQQASALENLETAALLGGNLWFRVPKSLPTILYRHDDVSGISYYYYLDDLIAAFLPEALHIDTKPVLLRLTRDGDFSVDLEDSDPESIPDAIRTGLKRRDGGRPVRLQIFGPAGDTTTIDAIAKGLKLSSEQVFLTNHSLFLHGLWTLCHEASTHITLEGGTQLIHPAMKGFVPSFLAEKSPGIFDVLKERDILFHQPYDSFDGYVSFIQTACEDPQVVMIQQTVYRMDTISPLMEALKSAASQKRVRVAIELRARFDEFNNLRLTEDLRKAGVEVVFGFGKLKLHAKVAVVTRMEDGAARHYTHLSTGNYKAATAKQYTDFAVLTAHAGLGSDALAFFDAVAQGNIPLHFTYLVHAPARLHRRLIAHIKAETSAARKNKKARIFAKVNALVDESVVNHLYEASQAGVQVDLVVRGACSLVPGIKGLSDNIRVFSHIDRYLEHSRIYYFEHTGAMYFSSADWMPRNFFSRLELAYPVLSPRIYSYIRDTVMPIYLNANHKAWLLSNKGLWSRINPLPGEALRRAQFTFQEMAQNQYGGTALSYETEPPANLQPTDFLKIEETLLETLSQDIKSGSNLA